MKSTLFCRTAALSLSALLLLTPCAQALTPEQAGELLEKYYVDDIPAGALEKPTIQEMVDALGDPYTDYFTPIEYALFTASMSDTQVEGIGVAMTINEEKLAVLTKVYPNSPAAAAGLQVGDVLLYADKTDLRGLTMDEIAQAIRGTSGSKVILSYRRGGKEYTVPVIRAQVVIPTVTAEVVDGHIGWIECTSFGAKTAQHVLEAIAAYDKAVDVWVFDLRGNGGGYVTAAQDAAGAFVGAGDIAYFRYGDDSMEVAAYQGKAYTTDPVIVLVDEETASASELFASAIQGYNAGIVIGTRTFGKGVAQTLFDRSILPDFFPDGDGMKITTSRFYGPTGNTTDQMGVIPDLLVDDAHIEAVAQLFHGPDRTEEPGANWLMVNLTWPFLIDLRSAQPPAGLAPFLNALSEQVPMALITDTDDLEPITPSELAQRYKLNYAGALFSDHDESVYGVDLSILKSSDLVRGKGDGRYHPQDTLTRAELCQLLSNALNLSAAPGTSNPYTDVPSDAWYTSAVLAMSTRGLVKGVGGDRFAPEAPVDHQQFITIMGRLAQWINLSMDLEADTYSERLYGSQLSKFDSWAHSSVWLLSRSQKDINGESINLLWDELEQIDPAAPTTRDEAAFLLSSLLIYIDVLTIG